MNEQSQHPVVACFDGLLGIRETIRRYVMQNPKDLGGLFTNFCAISSAHSQAQLFQDLLVIFAWQRPQCATRVPSRAKWKLRFAPCGSIGVQPRLGMSKYQLEAFVDDVGDHGVG